MKMSCLFISLIAKSFLRNWREDLSQVLSQIWCKTNSEVKLYWYFHFSNQKNTHILSSKFMKKNHSGLVYMTFVCRYVRITGLLSTPLVLWIGDWLCVMPAITLVVLTSPRKLKLPLQTDWWTTKPTIWKAQ